MNKPVYILSIALLLLVTCSKDDGNGGDPGQQLLFESLVADRYNLNAGESTRIVATASGYKISYHWAATAGDILGSGAEVIYAPSPCHAGENEISCEVRDGNNHSQTKSVHIVVE